MMVMPFRNIVSGLFAGLLGVASAVLPTASAYAVEEKEAGSADGLLLSMSKEFLENSGFVSGLGLDGSKLDYSVESLKQIDAALQKLHDELPDGTDGKDLMAAGDKQLQFVTLSLGSYVGEVLRRHLKQDARWEGFGSLSEDEKQLFGNEKDIGNAYFIRWADGVVFPMSKVMKFLANGDEDSVYFYAKVILKDTKQVDGDGTAASR
ncbi:hypothetical protein [Mesorhizobium japonicum]|uniref:Mlr0017 protein n=1 Tax=Mesorhizobium japonicum (strain LMG 29417 / CECT 9101 / MAFF 303099) TaxID=266835 RepID=Q98NR6_RHILO|nr:hypothetical protein [Mesorhizobium japonicum]BAB47695.1 mlr0017 [Mesorhizobium japonicum MAFF 303099]